MVTTFNYNQTRSFLIRIIKSKNEKKTFQLHNHVESVHRFERVYVHQKNIHYGQHYLKICIIMKGDGTDNLEELSFNQSGVFVKGATRVLQTLNSDKKTFNYGGTGQQTSAS